MRRRIDVTALGLGLTIGLLPILYGLGSGVSGGAVIFFAVLLGFALLPYAVFVGMQDEWSRALAVCVLAGVAVLHLATTLYTFSILDEDALSGLLFFYPGPLLAAGVGVLGLLHRLGRRAVKR